MYFRDRFQELKLEKFDYVIVDTDVGGDDCQALIALFHYCKLENKKLLGISCCNGNAVIEDVVTNVLITQAICGENYPVYKGNDNSIGGQNLKDYYFGEDGFGGRQKKYVEELGEKIDRSLVKELKSYKFIAETARQYKGNVALICLGPLSNLALAYHYDNSIVDSFSSIVIMGCADTLVGLNFHFTAEFNIGLDPEAGFIVFDKFKKILLVDLDTSIIGVDQAKLAPLFLAEDTPKGRLVKDLYTYMSEKPKKNDPLFCDPLAVLALFRPECIVSGMNIQMHVETRGHRTRGCTVVDYFSQKSQQPNCYLVKEFNLDILLEQTLKTYQ